MAILTIEQRHDLRKALLFCPSKIYSALYVHVHDFRTNFNVNTFFWIEDFIEINKRQQTHHTHTKYTIYIE